MSYMTNTKQMLSDACKARGDDPNTLTIFITLPIDYVQQPHKQVTFNEVPTRPFDSGYGGVNGEAIVAYSAKYIYFKGQYDGAEWITSLPLHPDNLTPSDFDPIGG